MGDGRIFFVGNTMIDTLLCTLHRLQPPSFWQEAGLTAGGYLVMTLHRPVNVDDAAGFARLLAAVQDGAGSMPEVFTVHPRTAKTLAALPARPAGLIVVDPQPYLEFNYLGRHACGVITDSGGVTEETTASPTSGTARQGSASRSSLSTCSVPLSAAIDS